MNLQVGVHHLPLLQRLQPLVVSSENGVSQNNPHYAILGETPIYNIGWEGITVKRAAYDVSLYARCMDGKKKQLTVALVDAENQIVAQAKMKVQGSEWNEYKTQLVISDKYKGNWARISVLPLFLKARTEWLWIC